MPENPSVAVVIPAYNTEHVLGTAVSSALTQTRAPDEILVVDDGSVDRTREIAAAYHPPVRLIQQQNGGCASARNTAVQAATADLIALLDADDQLLPRHLEMCVQRWQQAATRVGHERVIVTGNAYRLTSHGLTRSTILPSRFPSVRHQRERILENNFVGIFTVYPRRLHDEVGLFDATLRAGEDRDLWTRALFSGWHVVAQPEAHAIYRMGGASLSADQEKMASSEIEVLAKVRDTYHSRLSDRERDYLDMRLDSPSPRHVVDAANGAIRASDWTTAATQLELAASMLPSDRRLRLRAKLARRGWGQALLTRQLIMTDQKLGRIQE